jgi:ribonuclease J
VRVQGLPVEEDRADFIADACDAAAEAVNGGRKPVDKLKEELRLTVRRTATRWTGKKPVVDVLVIEA